MQKDWLGKGGGGGVTSKNLFSRIAELVFSTQIFIQYVSNVQSLFADNLRAEPLPQIKYQFL